MPTAKGGMEAAPLLLIDRDAASMTAHMGIVAKQRFCTIYGVYEHINRFKTIFCIFPEFCNSPFFREPFFCSEFVSLKG